MRHIVRQAYNALVRPHLPRKIAAYNGVPVRNVRLFDATDVLPEYEAALLDAIRARVEEGDRVTIVGGGLGVSSVVAARQCGPEGEVIAYEASDERYERAQETCELGRVEETTTIRHAIVGDAVQVEGPAADASVVDPSDLPECDVLVLDCEGAEREILEEPFDARNVVVETHAFLDSPERAVRDLLTEQGYEVVDRGVELEEKGVFVLTAVRDAER